MSEETGEVPTYLDDMVDENPVLFASSETVLTIEDPNLHPMGKATAIFLFFTCMLGFLNGLDYASPDDGLVRPDEFVYRLALTAPDDTATFTGSVVDAGGNPMVNATVFNWYACAKRSKLQAKHNLNSKLFAMARARKIMLRKRTIKDKNLQTWNFQ